MVCSVKALNSLDQIRRVCLLRGQTKPRSRNALQRAMHGRRGGRAFTITHRRLAASDFVHRSPVLASSLESLSWSWPPLESVSTSEQAKPYFGKHRLVMWSRLWGH